jgi:hypothetical protein
VIARSSMEFRRCDVVNALWAVGLPFLMLAICTFLFAAVINHTSLMDISLVPEQATTLGVTIETVAYGATLPLCSAAGYVFARRLFVRHAVAVIYFPVMCCVLAVFSFCTVIAVNGGP